MTDLKITLSESELRRFIGTVWLEAFADGIGAVMQLSPDAVERKSQQAFAGSKTRVYLDKLIRLETE